METVSILFTHATRYSLSEEVAERSPPYFSKQLLIMKDVEFANAKKNMTIKRYKQFLESAFPGERS